MPLPRLLTPPVQRIILGQAPVSHPGLTTRLQQRFTGPIAVCTHAEFDYSHVPREDRTNELWNRVGPAMDIRVAGGKAAGVQD